MPVQKIDQLSIPRAPEIAGIFAEHNPKTDKDQVDAIGKLVADFGAIAAMLSPASRQRLIASKDRLRKLVIDFAAGLDAAPLHTAATNTSDVSRGEGLGPAVPAAEGRQRLDAYATPSRVEDWAGTVAGPTQLERDHGIARSTLHSWQRQGAVLGLLVGVRKHAFPIEQFVDGRPIEGLGRIMEAIGDPRTTWLWLREPNPGLSGAKPLTSLRAGNIDRVVETARANFGRW